MSEVFMQFHFLRPWGLLFSLAGLVLVFIWHRWRRRQDALRQIIAPHLLAHLSLDSKRHHRFLPIHGFGLLLVLGGIAVAGPTWDRVLPPFVDEQTRVTLIIDLSNSMAGNHTLALAQDRISDLAQRRPGWHIGLIGYGKSAHLILPNSRDRSLLSLYLNSLQAGMIPGKGRNLGEALTLATHTRPDATSPLSLILVTDNLAASQLDQGQALPAAQLGLLVLAPADSLVEQASAAILHGLSADARAITGREQDVRWLEERIQAHFTRHQNMDETLKWRDLGYWLVWPALLLGLFSIRKGWRVQWCLLPLTLLVLAPPPAQAGPLADAFLTPDQQGRLAFESGQYAKAARQFQDPYLRGLAAYRAADFDQAIESFRQLDTAEAWFYLGNSYARQLELHKAITAYQSALEKRPQWPAATANLALVTRLSRDLDQDRQQAPDMEADDVRFDPQANKGKAIEIQAQGLLSDEIWLQNLSTSATEFLRRKFALEQSSAQRLRDED